MTRALGEQCGVEQLCVSKFRRQLQPRVLPASLVDESVQAEHRADVGMREQKFQLAFDDPVVVYIVGVIDGDVFAAALPHAAVHRAVPA